MSCRQQDEGEEDVEKCAAENENVIRKRAEDSIVVDIGFGCRVIGCRFSFSVCEHRIYIYIRNRYRHTRHDATHTHNPNEGI